VAAPRRKLVRELRQLRGQVLTTALVMVSGIGTMVMALTNCQAPADTRALFCGEYRFA